MLHWKSFSRVILLLALLTSLLAGLFAPALVDEAVSAAPRAANSLDVVISEVAWGGTAANSADEWIELYNRTSVAINLSGWDLTASDGEPNIALTGIIPANGYYLLESGDDTTISNISADQIYSGTLGNSPSAEILNLSDGANLIDVANSNGGAWDAGSGSPNYYSMERNMAVFPGDSWVDGVTNIVGLDLNNNPLFGTPHNSKIDLSILMSVNNETPIVGTDIVFTIIVTNNGNYDATNVSIKDVLSTAGLTYVSNDGGVTFTNGVGIWAIGTLNKSASMTLNITATVTAAGVKTNRAEIWTVDQFDPDSTPGNGITTEDDYALAKAITPGAASLSIANTVNNQNPTVGTNVIFTITVNNPSTSLFGATNVEVAALLPTGLTYISSSSGSYNGSTGIWTIGTLPIGVSATLNITAKVITSSPPPYSATVTSDEFLPSTATVTFTPLSGAADLILTQSQYTLSTTAGNAILHISLKNNGPDTATGVVVKDLLPSGLTFVSYASVPSTTTYSSSTGFWTINSLANTATATLNITVKVAASGTSTNNFAEVINSDQYDPVSTNNSASMEVSVMDLSLSERVDIFSTTAIFTLTVSNSGPDDATEVIVKNSNLATSYNYISHGNTAGTYNTATGDWTIPTLLDGASATLTVTTTTSGSLPVNWAQVSSVKEVDTDSLPNNCANTVNSCTEDDDASAPSADLSVAQFVSNANPDVNATLVITVIVNNAGPASTTNVQVRDVLPNGLRYVSYTSDVGTYTSSSGIWEVGTLASGASKSLNITVKVGNSGIKINPAEVWKSDQADPDSRPANGITTEDDYASAVITSYRSIIINEIAWGGTAASADDEWIELYNPSLASIDISGWKLKSASGSIDITLLGTIKPGEYFLLEREDNNTVKDITADQIYNGALSDNGERLTLCDNLGSFIDTANQEGSNNLTNTCVPSVVSPANPWPRGSNKTPFGTMERQGTSAENDNSWGTNTGSLKNGKDANNGLIYGTPRKLNSTGNSSSTNPGAVKTATPSPRLVGRFIINEFLARPGFDWNQDGKVDVFDEFIEIKNVGAADLSLSGWKLDDEANLGSAPFALPAVTLKPFEYIVFYGLETNILLSDGGDSVRLLNASNQVYDSITYTIAKAEDQSTCRLPDTSSNEFGFGQWFTDCIPTPNLANTREGTIPSMPGGEIFGPAICALPDTLPADFLFAECRGYGSNIWNTLYWDQPGWQGEQNVPENMSKWETFVK
ncbi:MAG: DUF11 domain-containing protein [Chloroflexi bacterium]|nr:DUF11 domain-containing protein [Chloroflexota bacterium]